jgi:hypothetical protein
VLDGEGTGPVNNLCAPSEVAESCAPPGKALISATVLGLPEASDTDLLVEVGSPGGHPARVGSGLDVAGDYQENASIAGALAGGRRAAEAVQAAAS